MAYSKTTWVDRAVATPNKYTKSGETPTEVTLIQAPGTITQAGTPINANNLNKIEVGLEAAAAIADTALAAGNAALPKAGGIMTGGVTIDAVNGMIELGKIGSSNTPYIDFHSSANVNDYDARMIATGGAPSTGQGTIDVISSDFMVNGVTVRNKYITPSDTVILSSPTEKQGESAVLKIFNVRYGGKYRLKGEIRSATAGSTARIYALIAPATTSSSISHDSSSPNALPPNTPQTTSGTYVAFSTDFAIDIPPNSSITIYAMTNSSNTFVRNVTLCGSEGYENNGVNSIQLN
ncbi:hypothetical protein [Paenibacillus sp. sgz302251]|uniref:hypothetical protein n=1 Tax=Paenibacillus sp. sgz302251 TaxID=3414493 RepID=UPI003C7DDD47